MHIFFSKFKGKDLLVGVLLAIWLIILAVLIVTFIPTYYIHHIESYGIPRLTGLSAEAIAKNYCSIIHYLSLFTRGPMITPDFTLTRETMIHFQDVKVLYTVAEIYEIVAIVPIVLLIRSCLKDREVEFMKLTVIMLVIFGVIVGIVAMSDFDAAFTLFHKILFNNDYWLINPLIDPIINIFPEEYFAALAVEIGVILAFAGTLLVVGYLIGQRYFMKAKENGN
ncbi:MAG: TIGR01906 family membrane protein [Erysipelotrichaceae bacterium]|nr:TIGR01906 family membrane protein [Erysipelotrichaceae bacterium]